MLHLPILRWGVPYRSVSQVVTPHFRTREPLVTMSQANVGLIKRDLLKQAEARALLLKIPVAELVTMANRAADHFLNDTLPLDPESGSTQTPQQYIEQVSATTGMPFSNVRRNMLKVHGVLDKVEEVLAGLTRGLDLSGQPPGLLPQALQRVGGAICRGPQTVIDGKTLESAGGQLIGQTDNVRLGSVG